MDFSFIKSVFNRDYKRKQNIKKEVAGFEVGKGIVIGPTYFSTTGYESTALLCPSIWAFNFDISNIINHINKVSNTNVDSTEFQHLFNSTLDNLISDILIYFENRLKLITMKDKLGYKINSVSDAVRAYKKLADIDIITLCDINFLKQLDILRGKKHHTHRRYDVDFSICGEVFDNTTNLIKLVKKIRDIIRGLNLELEKINKDYEVKVEHKNSSMAISWTSINHAFDLVDGKIVKKKPINGLDKRNIGFFQIEINYPKI